jgi:hypothetical protein
MRRILKVLAEFSPPARERIFSYLAARELEPDSGPQLDLITGPEPNVEGAV